MQSAIEIKLLEEKGTSLEAFLVVPKQAKGIILFSHGSVSGRFSPRNQFVAEHLQQAGFATLLLDLLTGSEDQNYQNRFDIELLTKRLIEVVSWIKREVDIKMLPIGLFGASTGAAAAIKCSAEMKGDIQAIVSRGGRPDLAMPVLDQVDAPTLLIVGSQDVEVLALNQQAYAALQGTKKLEIVSGATHLFEEPGTLEKVALLAREWFITCMKEG